LLFALERTSLIDCVVCIVFWDSFFEFAIYPKFLLRNFSYYVSSNIWSYWSIYHLIRLSMSLHKQFMNKSILPNCCRNWFAHSYLLMSPLSLAVKKSRFCGTLRHNFN
jgi:hypothetical protein